MKTKPRKQLSMKRLTRMLMDYLQGFIGVDEDETLKDRQNHIKSFLDYVWKHKEEEL